jgi:hypothetical protein
MKNKLIKTGILATLAACMVVGTGCQKEEMKLAGNDASGTSGAALARNADALLGHGGVEIRLSDTWSAGLAELNLDIRRVAVHYKNSTVEFGGWVYLPARQQSLNILQYQEGRTAFLGASIHMPDGLIDEARIELGDNNTVMWIDKDGKHLKNLTLSSDDHLASASVNLRVNKSTKLNLMLDINAVQSIVVIGGGQTVLFHPKMKLARFTHESINGAPGEEIAPDTK